jgi:hypothetical protein
MPGPAPSDPVPESDPRAPGLPGESAARPDDTPPEYWRAFSIVAFTMNRFVIDQILRASRFFDNDIEAMVIFGALSHLNVAHLVPPGASPSETLGPNGRVPDAQPRMRPVRLRDLVQITGRPRETIRRKLDRLQAEGRIERVVDGWVLKIDSVDHAMTAHSVDAVRRFMQAARVIDGALADAARMQTREDAGRQPGR